MTADRVAEFQTALLLGEPPEGFEPDEIALEVDAESIDALAQRSGDTSIWHTRPGAAHGESRLLGARMDNGNIDPEARLAHGLSGLLLALRAAYGQHPALPIAGLMQVRYAAPVFEGATLSAKVEMQSSGSRGFVVTTDQLEPNLALTGRIVYGDVGETHDVSFTSLAEQQLYCIEEAAGMISALLGLGIEGEGLRVLLMAQQLRLLDLFTVGDTLEVAAHITSRTAATGGERITATMGIACTDMPGKFVAWGEATFLVMEPYLP